MTPFIALTDKQWFDFLASQALEGRVDEVNFWSPKATRPMKAMSPGEPVFFRLKRPHYAIAGYGFFAHFRCVSLEEAWLSFGWKNGDPTRQRFLERIGDYRGIDLLETRQPQAPLGCTILRDAHFWPEQRWIAWGPEMGWSANIVQGKTEEDPARASRLLAEITVDAQDPPPELGDRYQIVNDDHRLLVVREGVQREGQGTFRQRLLDAYDGRCAITGEHTQPVLDAAHIQPYLGPMSNHPQNGLLLTKEFHALFDLGYIGITPDLRVHVSPRLKSDWQNGRRYYPYDGQQLTQVPASLRHRPSPEALEWHFEKKFLHSA